MHDDIKLDSLHPSYAGHARNAQQFIGYVKSFMQGTETTFQVGMLASSALHAGIRLALMNMRKRADSVSVNSISVQRVVILPDCLARLHIC